MALVQEIVVPQLFMNEKYAPVAYEELKIQEPRDGKMKQTLFRKKLPLTLISSHRTTTIFWPERACLAIIDASRPSKCPLPSMTIGVEEKVAILRLQIDQTKGISYRRCRSHGN